MALPDQKIIDLVKKSGVLDTAAIKKAEDYAVGTRSPNLVDAFIESGVLSEDQLGAIIAGYYNVPYVALSKESITEDVAHIIPDKVARRQKAIAFARDANGVKVALNDPTNKAIVSMIIRKTGQKVTTYYANESEIEGTVQLYEKALQRTIDELLQEYVKQATLYKGDLPIIKVVDELVNASYHDRASDVHIEPEEKTSLIRFRIDGVLQDVLRVPREVHDRIISRIKVLSNLRTDEHLSAQDGKMTARLEEENLDIRVSILPVTQGEKAVLRLLSGHSREYTLTDLGMNAPDLQKVTNAFNRSFGMILSTGPTGSGKTTSIYAILKVLNTREKNIMTIEDPVEYRIAGSNQVQVNSKTNLTFANGLRSILRQDPNVIFVGEIRDGETAGIAVNAALTGHLVLSTLHTNDAATAIPRLSDMKVEPFLVASTVNVIIAQRLVRQICSSCKSEEKMAMTEVVKHFPQNLVKRYFGNTPEVTVHKGKGCKICRQTGYTGRVGLFEVLEVTKEIRKLISGRADSDVIAQAAIAEGMKTMLDDGLEKVAMGVTTMEEVIRVTKVESV
ncbi:MAG: General secretory pathway protein E [Candidatus Woesebacteria bacterium GW2011_GWB1_39_10]|uniref:General secretory pathway protein E n=2 Tax=Candidatus Woeseibacteriota TaxID=1752722 RepID=A0A0G0XWN2_9BACT|nr:MAG: General secretory pathway protein E [Candidatus Woesebacteria bacterium GW2011_GWB1_39_10]KKR92302.1 MAG: General secretory pathway protein E [Candidatus Woesebacteria bacterium GW2011_GWA1_41_13b]